MSSSDQDNHTNQNSKPKWTPGPWKPFIASHVISVCLPRKNPKDRLIEVVHWCGFDSSDIEDIPELKANCHLIAAAPELYEALELAQQYLVFAYQESKREGLEASADTAKRDFAIIANALAKARGESNE